MAELRPVSEGGRSKYVLQLEADDIQYSTHRECDEVIRNLLNRTDNARLRYPQSRQDYHDLVVLIIENYPYLIDQKHITHYSDIVKKNYTGADVPEDVFGEVKRIMDICLEHGRFRDVRVLGELNLCCYLMHSIEKRRRWILQGQQEADVFCD